MFHAMIFITITCEVIPDSRDLVTFFGRSRHAPAMTESIPSLRSKVDIDIRYGWNLVTNSNDFTTTKDTTTTATDVFFSIHHRPEGYEGSALFIDEDDWY